MYGTEYALVGACMYLHMYGRYMYVSAYVSVCLYVWESICAYVDVGMYVYMYVWQYYVECATEIDNAYIYLCLFMYLHTWKN
jgi:hypothetical protein